jgi:two-component system chemotaxis response regulator CheB
MKAFDHVIVVGASAGGLRAITDLIAAVPENLQAPVFIVQHISRMASADIILKQLKARTTMPCFIAGHGMKIVKAVYIAPPDHHLFLKEDHMLLLEGPAENRWRPAIDVLFRSAAVSFNSRAIGIVLSGLLDDGTSGMIAIKKCGGITIVQEPSEAEFADMPRNVLRHVDVDYRVPVNDMGYVLQDIATKPVREPAAVPEEIEIEAKVNEQMGSAIDQLRKIGTHSDFTCPDCGGNLWHVNGEKMPRYRCHTGHVYSEPLLVQKQGEVLEESLWIAIRLMEERKKLFQSVEKHREAHGMGINANHESEQMTRHIERLKKVLVDLHLPKPGSAPDAEL